MSDLASTAPDAVEGVLNYIVDTGERPVVYATPPGQAPKQTGTYARHPMTIHDGRPLAAEFSLDVEGIAFLEHDTAVEDFYDDTEVEAVYYPEIERLLVANMGAEKALVFDHQARHGGAEPHPGIDGPVHVAHNDYTELSAPKRVHKMLDEAEAQSRVGRRFAIVNVWRPIRGPILATPLAVCDARTLAPGDLLAADLVYEDWTGEVYRITHRPDHRWYYFPDMERGEALIFKGYDSLTDGTARFAPHTAFDDPTSPPDAAPRESIEARALIFF